MNKYDYAIETFGEDVVEELKRQLTKAKKKSSGSLQKSIEYITIAKKDGSKIAFVANDYFEYVDQGRKKNGKIPNIGDITKWASLNGISKKAIWPIAISIAKKGIKATNVLAKSIQSAGVSKAFNDFEDNIFDWVDFAVEDILENLENENIKIS